MKKDERNNTFENSLQQELDIFADARRNLKKMKEYEKHPIKLDVRNYGQVDIEDFLEEQSKQQKIVISYCSPDNKSVFRLQSGKQTTYYKFNQQTEKYEEQKKNQQPPELPWYKRVWNKVFCCCKFSAQQTHEEEKDNETLF